MTKLCDLKNDRILITGASGLIGINLIKALQNIQSINSPRITIVTKSGTLPPIGVDFERLNVLRGDLLDESFLKSLPESDIIFHAAGYGQPAKFLKNAIGTVRLNCDVTSALAEKTCRGGRFVFFSSSEVYSGAKSFPNSEFDIGTTDPYHPRAAYIEGKRVGEAITNLASHEFDISTVSLRVALVFGPGTKSDDTRVLNSFISRALRDKKIIMMDRGSALRTYCFIDDAVRMVINIAQYGQEPVYNVGGIEMVSIRELGEMISLLTGSVFEMPNQDLGLSSAPSVVKLNMARTLETFQTPLEFTSLVEGLRLTIDWQRKHLF